MLLSSRSPSQLPCNYPLTSAQASGAQSSNLLAKQLVCLKRVHNSQNYSLHLQGPQGLLVIALMLSSCTHGQSSDRLGSPSFRVHQSTSKEPDSPFKKVHHWTSKGRGPRPSQWMSHMRKKTFSRSRTQPCVSNSGHVSRARFSRSRRLSRMP